MFICQCCFEKVDEDPREIFEDFLEYIREEHDDYDIVVPSPGLCLSCAIDEYEEDLYEHEFSPGNKRLGEDDPVVFDPVEPDPYDSD